MAVDKTRVSRKTGDDEDQLELGADVALVGDPNDGASIIAEDSDDDAGWDEQSNGENRQQRQTARKPKEEREDAGYDEEDSRLAYSESGDEDEGPRGQSRRSRRNAGKRRYQTALESQNNELKQRIDELTGTVSRLVTGQKGLAVNTLDGQFSNLQNQLRIVDDEMANAIKNSDGDTYSRAQKLRDEIVGRMYGLKNNRDRLAKTDDGQEGDDDQGNGEGRTPQRQQQRQSVQAQPNPQVAEYFDRFCDRFDWFDPNSSSANCNIVRAVDAELVAEGYRRDTPVFWRNLERRLAEDYKLAPNTAPSDQDDEREDREDERPGREVNRQQRSRPPTNGGRSASSGRGAGFRLSDVQTNILREEGLLEENLSDDDKAKRQRIVDKWKRGAASERRGTLQ